jgi:hypothetical protein
MQLFVNCSDWQISIYINPVFWVVWGICFVIKFCFTPRVFLQKFFFDGQSPKEISLKKAQSAPKCIQRIPKQKNQKNQRKYPQNPKDRINTMSLTIETQNPQKNTGLHYKTARALLPFPLLEPTPLASKLIEHSKFLSSLLPFGLEAETGIS